MKAEPVRDTIKRSMSEARGEKPEPADGADEEAQEGDDPIGLVENADDVAFQCATCDYFEDGVCQHPREPDGSDAMTLWQEIKRWCRWHEGTIAVSLLAIVIVLVIWFK